MAHTGYGGGVRKETQHFSKAKYKAKTNSVLFFRGPISSQAVGHFFGANSSRTLCGELPATQALFYDFRWCDSSFCCPAFCCRCCRLSGAARKYRIFWSGGARKKCPCVFVRGWPHDNIANQSKKQKLVRLLLLLLHAFFALCVSAADMHQFPSVECFE